MSFFWAEEFEDAVGLVADRDIIPGEELQHLYSEARCCMLPRSDVVSFLNQGTQQEIQPCITCRIAFFSVTMCMSYTLPWAFVQCLHVLYIYRYTMFCIIYVMLVFWGSSSVVMPKKFPLKVFGSCRRLPVGMKGLRVLPTGVPNSLLKIWP